MSFPTRRFACAGSSGVGRGGFGTWTAPATIEPLTLPQKEAPQHRKEAVAPSKRLYLYLPRRKHIGRNPAGDQPFGQLVGVGADSVVPERVYQSDGSRTGHAYAARGEAKPAAAARSADSR